MNFPDVKVDIRDIKEVKEDEIPPFDVLLAGFPCQAFSVAGYRQGFYDEKGRGNLFFELIRIMKVHRPRVAFFENVNYRHPLKDVSFQVSTRIASCIVKCIEV